MQAKAATRSFQIKTASIANQISAYGKCLERGRSFQEFHVVSRIRLSLQKAFPLRCDGWHAVTTAVSNTLLP